MGSQFKGYPSKHQLMMTDPADIHVTAEPIRESQVGITTLAHMFVTLINADAVEALSTTKKIVATAHNAKVGDIVSFSSGIHNGREVKVVDVDANNIFIGEDLGTAPTAADTFDILRHLYPRLTQGGNIQVTTSTFGFNKDGVNVEVNEDTVVPANNIPLPVKLTGLTGDLTVNAGELNIHQSHVGVNYDSIRLGDGTDLLAINADGSTNVVNITPSLDTKFIHRHDYSSGNVTTAAYTQLIASTTTAITKLQIFDSSGRTMVLAIGGVGVEADKVYVIPGGNGSLECVIPAASRVSVKAVSANATVGELVINFIG